MRPAARILQQRDKTILQRREGHTSFPAFFCAEGSAGVAARGALIWRAGRVCVGVLYEYRGRSWRCETLLWARAVVLFSLSRARMPGLKRFFLGDSGHEPLRRCIVLVECVANCRDCKTFQVGVGLRGAADVIEHDTACSGGAAPLSFRPASPFSRPAAGARPVLGAHDARQKPWSRVSAAAGGGNGAAWECLALLVACGAASRFGACGGVGGWISA